MGDVHSYKCPNCGAPLAFDIEKQNLACKFCLSEFVPDGVQEEGDSEPAIREAPREAFGDEARAYTCPSCGGRIVTDSNTAATFCAYCHNPTLMEDRLSGQYRPAMLIPFQMEKPQVVDAMLRLLRKRPLLPRDFRAYAEEGEITGLYVPFWLFGCQVDAFLAAHGYRVAQWSDSRYVYTKTDTYHVERAADITFRNLPADGSARMDEALMQGLEPFDYSGMVDFHMSYLSGHFAESYDVDAQAASGRAFARMQAGSEEMMRGLVEGYTRYRVNAFDYRQNSVDCTYVMLPVWTLTARYRDRFYTFAMNGQTGKMVGKLPVSRARVALWFCSIAAAVTAVLFTGGMLL